MKFKRNRTVVTVFVFVAAAPAVGMVMESVIQ